MAGDQGGARSRDGERREGDVLQGAVGHDQQGAVAEQHGGGEDQLSELLAGPLRLDVGAVVPLRAAGLSPAGCSLRAFTMA